MHRNFSVTMSNIFVMPMSTLVITDIVLTDSDSDIVDECNVDFNIVQL